jgi:hypothetical protein
MVQSCLGSSRSRRQDRMGMCHLHQPILSDVPLALIPSQEASKPETIVLGATRGAGVIGKQRLGNKQSVEGTASLFPEVSVSVLVLLPRYISNSSGAVQRFRSLSLNNASLEVRHLQFVQPPLWNAERHTSCTHWPLESCTGRAVSYHRYRSCERPSPFSCFISGHALHKRRGHRCRHSSPMNRLQDSKPIRIALGYMTETGLMEAQSDGKSDAPYRCTASASISSVGIKRASK